MKHLLFILQVLLIPIVSCSRWRQELFHKGGTEEMIQNAVIDFIHTENRLLQNNSCFHVFTTDSQTVVIIGDENKVSLIVDIKKEITHIVRRDVNERGSNIIVDSNGRTIMSLDYSEDKYHPKIWFDEGMVDISYRAFPDKLLEYKDKLFFWFSDNRPAEVDERIINTLYNHHYVDTLVMFDFWPGMIDDERRGKVYYFDKDDLRKYKKRTTL